MTNAKNMSFLAENLLEEEQGLFEIMGIADQV